MQTTEYPETRVATPIAGFAGGQVRPARRFLPQSAIAECQTFRDACVLAWKHRAVPSMTHQMLAVLADLQPQHVSDYFKAEAVNDKGNARRALPAEKIDAVERVLGNHVLTQFVVHRGMLTIMEAVIAERTA